MKVSRDYILRWVWAIAAVIWLAAPSAQPANALSAGHALHGHEVANTGGGRTAAAEHAAHERSARPHHAGGHGSAEPRAHCRMSLTPHHCEICQDRAVVGLAAARHRAQPLLSWHAYFNQLSAAVALESPILVRREPIFRPPDRVRPMDRASRPLSLAHRFRI